VAVSGVARVVIATGDPNPLVNGKGLEILRARGISVTTGVLEAEARVLNAPFFTVMTRRRPFITVKVALSADHRIAVRPGVRTPLTGPASARLIHRDRAEVDAIAVGSGTVLADDPLLTPRGAFRYRPLVRVVFDSRLRTPAESRLFSTLKTGPVIIVSSATAVERARDRAESLIAVGAELLTVAADAPILDALRQLAGRGISSMMVEGGVTLHRAFWDADVVDRVQMYMTPHRLGAGGLEWLPAPLPGLGPMTRKLLGTDILIEGYVYRPD
jgi:diaminohydroxyphosphoribosylaminopyrimidine deaminase/5-amino-6-(5-phosphoribosylamino)uracil reductase